MLYMSVCRLFARFFAPLSCICVCGARYLGETEAKLRALFARARAAAPCILFLDELDAITAKRGDGGADAGGGAGGVHARVLSTLLNEMDGVATTSAPRRSGGGGVDRGGGVLVLAATNRRDALDAALLRPGRLHESVEFGMPGREDREGVLRVHVRRLPLSAEVDIARLSQDDVSGGLSCADIEVKIGGRTRQAWVARKICSRRLARCEDALWPCCSRCL